MASVREGGYAVSARYDRQRSRVAVVLNTGIPSFPTRLAEVLAGAPLEHLADIEISPAGIWPGSRLDADLYVPALLPRVFRLKSGMARVLGGQGGRARTVAKAAASRENGRKGRRPRKGGAV